MRRGTKIVLVLSTSVCIVGAALFGVGLASGGADYMKSADLNAWGDEGKTQQLTEKQIKLKSFDRVNIKGETVDVVVVPSDQKGSYLSYSVKARKGEAPLSYAVKNHVLYIEETTDSSGLLHVSGHIDIGLAGWLFGNRTDGEEKNVVTLHLANDVRLKESRITLDDGDLSVEGMQCDNVDWTLHYGDLTATDTTLKDGSVTLDDGDIATENVTAHAIKWINTYGDWAARGCTLRGGSAELEDGDLTMRDSRWSNGVLTLDYGDWSGKDVVLNNVSATLSDGDVSMQRLTLLGANTMDNDYGDVELKLTPERKASIVEKNHVDSEDGTSSHQLRWKDGTTLHIRCSDGESILS